MSSVVVQPLVVTEEGGADDLISFSVIDRTRAYVYGVAAYKTEAAALPLSSRLIPDLDDMDEIILPANTTAIESTTIEFRPIGG